MKKYLGISLAGLVIIFGGYYLFFIQGSGISGFPIHPMNEADNGHSYNKTDSRKFISTHPTIVRG